jgi:hypothetical protein
VKIEEIVKILLKERMQRVKWQIKKSNRKGAIPIRKMGIEPRI